MFSQSSTSEISQRRKDIRSSLFKRLKDNRYNQLNTIEIIK